MLDKQSLISHPSSLILHICTSAHLHEVRNLLEYSNFGLVQMVFRGVQIFCYLYSNHLFFVDSSASLFYQIQSATTSAAAK